MSATISFCWWLTLTNVGEFVGHDSQLLKSDQFKGAGMFMSSCWKYMVYVSTSVSVETHFGPLSHGWAQMTARLRPNKCYSSPHLAREKRLIPSHHCGKWNETWNWEIFENPSWIILFEVIVLLEKLLLTHWL